MKPLSIITTAGALGMGLGLLWHFSSIWRYGSHYIQEPRLPVLVFEIVLVSTLAMLLLIRLFKEVSE